ncbi:YraN family protein [Timonella sp. A28]|uniref:YraN family protein n=1 Tax=Timonella sp. A28 TaxID=3442640 RepID=UPI003EBA7580
MTASHRGENFRRIETRTPQYLRPHDIGRIGEDLAEEYLLGKGYQILARNWRSSGEVRGELDIVAQQGHKAVFVEVKTRTTQAFGSPAQAITHRKLQTIVRLSAKWLQENSSRYTSTRVDAVIIRLHVTPDRRTIVASSVDHIQGISAWR